MGTFTRLSGTLHTVEAVRCDAHSDFDPDGFALPFDTDPTGIRCWTPRVGAPCSECGADA